MMVQASCPLRYWVQACNMAVFITKRVITAALPESMTPFEAWHHRKPSLAHLRVFGCRAYQLIRKELRRSKCTPVSSEGVLVGTAQDNFNYHMLDLKDKKTYITTHVTFDESSFPFDLGSIKTYQETQVDHPEEEVNVRFFDSATESDLDEIFFDEVEPVIEAVSQEKEVQLKRSVPRKIKGSMPTRKSARVQQLQQATTSNVEEVIEAKHLVAMHTACNFSFLPPQCNSITVDLSAPKSFRKAIECPEGEIWLKACDKEIK